MINIHFHLFNRLVINLETMGFMFPLINVGVHVSGRITPILDFKEEVYYFIDAGITIVSKITCSYIFFFGKNDVVHHQLISDFFPSILGTKPIPLTLGISPVFL